MDWRDGVLYDDDGEAIATRDDARLVRAAARFLVGRVLEGGLGLGFARRVLCQRHARVETVEVHPDVVSFWRAWKGRLADVDDSPEDTDRIVTRDDIRNVLAAKKGLPRAQRPQSALFHVPLPLYQDPDLIRDAAATFDRLGQRIVLVISGQRRGTVEIPGWRVGRVRYVDGGSFQVMDRWDPENGLGEVQTVRPTGRAYLDLGGTP